MHHIEDAHFVIRLTEVKQNVTIDDAICKAKEVVPDHASAVARLPNSPSFRLDAAIDIRRDHSTNEQSSGQN